MPLRGLVLIAFFAASVPVCFFRPFYGVVLWTIVAFLNPQSHTWSAFDAFPWALAVAVPTVLGMFAFERNFSRFASREVGLLALLWAWFTITTLVSVSTPEFMHHAAETWERWNFVSKILLMTLCMVPIVNSIERLRYLALTIAFCFGFYVLKAFPFIISSGGAFRLYGPERSMIADNTDFGLALNMTLPFFFFLAHTETKRWLKGLLWFLFAITIPAIFFTYSRGALVGLCVVFFLLMIRSRRAQFILIPLAALSLVVALTFAPEAWKARMNLTSSEAVDGSAQSRLMAWAYARALAADYPITGGGFSTFTEELYTRYWPGQVGTIYGPHSIYFQVLAEHGYVGLLLYLLVVMFCLATARRLRKAAKSRSDGLVGYYSQMFQMSLIGFLISGVFLGRAYFDYFFAIVACITILDRCARDRWAVEPSLVTVPGAVPALGGLPPQPGLRLPGPQPLPSGGK